MRFSTFSNLALVLITSVFMSACGGGGSSTPTPAPIPSLAAVKTTAVSPVLNGGTTTITFNFGTSVADGTVVTYTVSPASAVLSGKTNVTSGIATVHVTSSSQANVTVTAGIATATGSKTVQFIPQPDKVVVHLALTRSITNLEWLAFGLQNNLAWTFASYSPAPGYISYNDAAKSTFLDGGSNFYSWAIYLSGLNVVPATNLLEMTFVPAATAGIPFFEIFTPLGIPGNLSYYTYSVPTTHLATTDFTISTDYYLGATLLATN